MNRSILYIILLALVASCQTQEEPDIVDGTPVFMVKGTIDGKALLLEAGKNNYYMHGDFSAGADGVYTFSGKLAPQNCISCAPALSFSIRNYTASPAFSMDSALQAGGYSFFRQNAPPKKRYEVQFIPQSKGSGKPTHSWNLGNGQMSSLGSLTAAYPGPGAYTVTYSNTFPGGCGSAITQQIFIPPSPKFDGKTIDFTTNDLSARRVMFNSVPVDDQATVTWDFGDGSTGTGTITNHQYDTSGIFKVCMLFVKGSDSLRHCKNVKTNDHNGCITNFAYRSYTILDSLNLSSVNIEWTDAAGNIYSSAKAVQPTEAYFTVTESTPYLLNEKGLKTQMLKVIFTCLASDGTNQVRLENMQAVIAVSIP